MIERKMMKKSSLLLLLSAGLRLGVFAATANASSVLYDNLSATTTDADSVSDLGPLANSFSTGSSPASLAQVTLLLTGAHDSGTVTVQLLADSATNPGAVLDTIGTVSDTSLSSSLADYELTLSTPFALAADTRYWIELSSTDGSSAAWGWSYDISGTGVAGEDASNEYGVFPNDESGDAPYQMRIDATPEPSSLVLLGTGIMGLAGVIRRKFAA